jgi:pimeloyl-ACP methyl ester carboxylesterase
VLLAASPLRAGRSSVEIHVRDAGEGPPLVLLHGGWGYEAYPFDLAALAARRRVIAPDRSGYGRSGRLPDLPRGFHRLMAEETLLVLDELGIRQAAFWGHSDGAVIAAWIDLVAPGRVRALVLEALHFLAAKASSVEFFRTAVEAPERFGPAVVEALRRDHGARWREVLGAGGRAWLAIIEEGRRGRRDLFEGRLGEVRAPVLLLHGRRDPRTEPGEIEAALAELSGARLEMVDAGHCPHANERVGAECRRLAEAFLAEHGT